jgi:hypothetical protein
MAHRFLVEFDNFKLGSGRLRKHLERPPAQVEVMIAGANQRARRFPGSAGVPPF